MGQANSQTDAGKTTSPLAWLRRLITGDMHTLKSSYRPDLDGMRGVGAYVVLCAHAANLWPPGAFIAIDMFFVISGFLITRIIVRNMERGTFTFADFYSRRIRRLFPALFPVLAATLVFGWFFLLPEELRLLGKHAASGAFFFPNFAMWGEPGGYFEWSLAFKPLLILWSLGVEEQFYLVWPPLLLLFMRWRWKLPIVFCVLGAISFAINLWLSPGRSGGAAYYLPFGRAWEILAGAAMILVQPPTRAQWANIASLAGAAIMLVGFLVLSPEGYPGFWALAPVVGTCLLIWSGETATANRWLTWPPFVLTGLMSYPLYLWHWPLLTLQTIATGETLSVGWRIVAILASFLLAWLTYRFLERPARQMRGRGMVIGLCVAMIGVGLVGAGLWFSNGFPNRFPAQIQRVINARAELKQTVDVTWRSDHCFLYEDKGETAFASDCIEATPAAEPLVVVWGDSTAAAFFSGLRQLQPQLHVRLGQLTAARCPAVLSAAVAASRAPAEARCRAINDRALAEIRRARPDVVVLEGGWYVRPYLVSSLPYTINQLQAQGAKVILVGSPPLWAPPLPKRVLTAFRATSRWPERLPVDLTRLKLTDNQVADIARRYGVDFVSPTQALCNAQGCLTRVGDPPSLLTYDNIHLTPQGGRLEALVVAPTLKANLP